MLLEQPVWLCEKKKDFLPFLRGDVNIYAPVSRRVLVNQRGTDMPWIVNRCQTEVQSSLGSPSQASKMEELRKDLLSTDRRLDALDKRIDLLHTVVFCPLIAFAKHI